MSCVHIHICYLYNIYNTYVCVCVYALCSFKTPWYCLALIQIFSYYLFRHTTNHSRVFLINMRSSIPTYTPHPRDKALTETEPTAALQDDHSQQHSHMSAHSRDKALTETESIET
jgi:hypothetical protein